MLDAFIEPETIHNFLIARIAQHDGCAFIIQPSGPIRGNDLATDCFDGDLGAPHLRSNVRVDDVYLDSGDAYAPFFHDDVDGCGARPKAPHHHARDDGVRHECVYVHVREGHADARARVARLSAARRRFPSGLRQSGTVVSDYLAESERRSGLLRMALTKNTRPSSRSQYVEALRRTE